MPETRHTTEYGQETGFKDILKAEKIFRTAILHATDFELQEIMAAQRQWNFAIADEDNDNLVSPEEQREKDEIIEWTSNSNTPLNDSNDENGEQEAKRQGEDTVAQQDEESEELENDNSETETEDFPDTPQNDFTQDDDGDEREGEADDDSEDITLCQHLLEQWKMFGLKQGEILNFSQEQLDAVAEFIISKIDANGYFKKNLHNCTKELRTKDEWSGLSYEEIYELLGKTLERIRSFSPIGVASENIAKCLNAQIQHQLSKNPGFYSKEMQNTLKNIFEKKNVLNDILQGKEVKGIEECAILAILALNPYPATGFKREHEECHKTIKIKPDVEVDVREEQGTKVISIKSLKTTTRFYKSKKYQEKLKSKSTPSDEKEKIEQQFDWIDRLNDILKEHQHNILLLASLIVQNQEKFFTGSGQKSELALLTQESLWENFLTPYEKEQIENENLTKEEREKEKDRIKGNVETYISRLVANKYMKTPFGDLPFDYFFEEGGTGNEITSRAQIKEMILDIVSNPKKYNVHVMDNGKISKPKITNAVNHLLQERNEPPISREVIEDYCNEMGY